MPDPIGPKTRPPLSSELYAAGRLIGNTCFQQNLEFLKCKNKSQHPEHCSQQGQDVHHCVYDLYKDIAKKAPTEFQTLAECLDYNDLSIEACKNKQLAFEAAYYNAN